RAAGRLLQGAARPRRLVAEAGRLHREPAAREAQRQGYATVRERLGEPGVVDRVAQIVLQVAGEAGGGEGAPAPGKGLSRPGAEPRDGAASRAGVGGVAARCRSLCSRSTGLAMRPSGLSPWPVGSCPGWATAG